MTLNDKLQQLTRERPYALALVEQFVDYLLALVQRTKGGA